MVDRARRAAAVAVGLALAACGAPDASGTQQTRPGGAEAAGGCGAPAACEQRMAARFEAVRGDAAELARLLAGFPKGADLHNHMTGAVYAESYLAWAREDGFRVDRDQQLVEATRCEAGCDELPASPADPRFDAIIRAWSMKDFQPGAELGHDHFFAAFSKFRLVSHEAKREAAMLAETIRRAADDGAIYLEVMLALEHPHAGEIVKDAGAPDPQDLLAFARRLHADPRWAPLVAHARANLMERDRRARALLGCGSPGAVGSPPVCRIAVRYLAQANRTAAPALVFAELLLAFDVGAIEPRLVGLNISSPEDNPVALFDYHLHMAMVGALASDYRGKSPVRIALHAGELSRTLSTGSDMAFHIREAVEVAHAERIGHGVDVLSERDASGLLGEMHDRGVAVEICLTSNATILGVSGAAHPLAAYLAAGVPVLLATDDAGISRSSLTGELLRAVQVQGLGYPQLKALVRTSLTAAFVPGASLWSPGAPGAPAGAPRLIDACAAGPTQPPGDACRAFLATSERARLQWKLEQQLAAFEAR